jgi:hypothetical protein
MQPAPSSGHPPDVQQEQALSIEAKGNDEMSDSYGFSTTGMSIAQAKQQIKNAMIAYFTKDEYGNYVIPIERQRPIFLLGAPGIGKTAIMRQIAEELGVGLVSYSMTHHTRQSALGLPFIVKKEYGGVEYSVSEYTMSEIIASVYDCMEETGHDEGILFLDEINCVSETLNPAMLQFLQYKTFGRHAVPKGWIVVTAGNPPEYNKSVREFDIVTWDRLKRIDVAPNFEAWKEYAYSTGVHPSITTFLEIKQDCFYRIETTPEGKSFVTPRGWDDLSQMIKLYEQNDIEVDENLVVQYLQNRKIAKDFAIYYDLFNKYRSDYQISEILEGTEDETVRNRAEQAGLDERLSLLGLLQDAINQEVRDTMVLEGSIAHLHTQLVIVKERILSGEASPSDALGDAIAEQERQMSANRANSTLSNEKLATLSFASAFLSDAQASLAMLPATTTPEDAFGSVADAFSQKVDALDEKIETCKRHLDNLFIFVEETFGEGHEMLLLVTELSVNKYTVAFIGEYGCERYFKHNDELLFSERKKDIKDRLDRAGLRLK